MLIDTKRGFTLVEVLVATSLVVAAFAGLGHLAVLAARSSQSAHVTTVAVLAARQKLEELRGSAAALGASPPGTLDTNVPGFWDALDQAGRPTDAVRAALHRRWSITALREGARGIYILRVRIVRYRPRGSDVDVTTAVMP